MANDTKTTSPVDGRRHACKSHKVPIAQGPQIRPGCLWPNKQHVFTALFSLHRRYVDTHPEQFGERFDTAVFQAGAEAISFRVDAGEYQGAKAELRRRGSPARNIVGRALDFFALHDANERVEQAVRPQAESSGGMGGEKWLPAADWMDV